MTVSIPMTLDQAHELWSILKIRREAGFAGAAELVEVELALHAATRRGLLDAPADTDRGGRDVHDQSHLPDPPWRRELAA